MEDYYPESLRKRHGIQNIQPSEVDIVYGPSADIGWVPDHEKFLLRRGRLEKSRESDTNQALPDGWPEVLIGPQVWSGKDLRKEDYVFELLDSHRTDIDRALEHFKARYHNLDDIDISAINRSTFPLTKLSKSLDDLATDIYSGRGFFVLRGLDVKVYSRLDVVIIYVGVASYVGECKGRQNQNGLMMTHITETKVEETPDEKRRPIYTNQAQPFHTDLLCGVLVLFFLEVAEKGGETLLSSSWTVYNELATKRPDLIQILSMSNWIHDTFGRNPPYHQRPLLHFHDGKPILIFARRNLTGSFATPRTSGIPPMTEEQAEALDAVHFCAADNCVKIDAQVGDMCFINNFAVMHSRNSFQDSQEAKRYLLRLWLSSPQKGWEVPPSLKLAWDRIFEPIEEIEDYWELDPFDVRGRSLERGNLASEGFDAGDDHRRDHEIEIRRKTPRGGQEQREPRGMEQAGGKKPPQREGQGENIKPPRREVQDEDKRPPPGGGQGEDKKPPRGGGGGGGGGAGGRPPIRKERSGSCG